MCAITLKMRGKDVELEQSPRDRIFLLKTFAIFDQPRSGGARLPCHAMPCQK